MAELRSNGSGARADEFQRDYLAEQDRADAGHLDLPVGSRADQALFALFRVAAILGRDARKNGVSRRDIVLGALRDREVAMATGTRRHPYTQGQLAESMGVTSQSLGETLVRMEGEGLVARTVSERDSRSVCVELTPAGRITSREVVDNRAAYAADRLSVLDEDELEDFWKLMGKLNESL